MMRRMRVGLLVLLAIAIGVLAGWHGQQPLTPTHLSARLQPPSLQPPSSPQAVPSSPPRPSVSINRDRLMADVQALATQRYSLDERDRTRAYITQALTDAGWTPTLQPFVAGTNILAIQPGTDPTAGRLVVGAHYDSVERSPGADDNATAISALLELARVLKTVSTPVTLELAFFDLEEAGLVGSIAFVEQDAAPETLRGAVILEMLGYACHTDGCQQYPAILPITPPTTRGDFIAVIGDQGHPELIEAFVDSESGETPPVLTLSIPLLGPLTPDLLRSDHAPFWRQGLGAVMVTDTANFRNPHYHRASDTPDSLDQAFFAGVVQLTANAVLRLLQG